MTRAERRNSKRGRLRTDSWWGGPARTSIASPPVMRMEMLMNCCWWTLSRTSGKETLSAIQFEKHCNHNRMMRRLLRYATPQSGNGKTSTNNYENIVRNSAWLYLAKTLTGNHENKLGKPAPSIWRNIKLSKFHCTCFLFPFYLLAYSSYGGALYIFELPETIPDTTGRAFAYSKNGPSAQFSKSFSFCQILSWSPYPFHLNK